MFLDLFKVVLNDKMF